MKVFLLSAGEYSDFEIEGVFSSYAVAEGYARTKRIWSTCAIESFEVDNPDYGDTRVGLDVPHPDAPPSAARDKGA